MTSRDQKAIESDLLARIDPGGDLGVFLKGFSHLAENPLGDAILHAFGVDVSALNIIRSGQRLISDAAKAILTFYPVGWAPSGSIPSEPYSQALLIYSQRGSIEEAENHLVQAWNEGERLKVMVKRLATLGAGDKELSELARLRYEFVEKALHHHANGSYEASVPIILAQVDGLVQDLTESKDGFFGKTSQQQLRDDSTIAGMPEGLSHLQKLFGQDVKGSGITGQLKRHGIMHGRELGYDTKINSTKAFVLLIAVIEWGQPRARELANRRQYEREQRYAGSDATDQLGHRLDTRGFQETKDSLRRLATRQMAEYTRHGRYCDNIDSMFPGEHGDSFLHGRENISLNVSPNGALLHKG